jgi:hypothetical protein
MIVAPAYPRIRRAGRVRRVFLSLHRARLIWNITGAGIELASLQRIIDNDVTVIYTYPHLRPKLLPTIDARYIEREAIEKDLAKWNRTLKVIEQELHQ